MTISIIKDGVREFISPIEGCIFRKENKELLGAVNFVLKRAGFEVTGGNLESNALYLDVANSRCKTSFMGEQRIATLLRKHIMLPARLVVNGMTTT